MNQLNGEEKTTMIFTLMGMVFVTPFLIMMILNPVGFEINQTWSLIILGSAMASLPITIFGFYKTILFVSEQQNLREEKQ